ncbi:MAG: phage portal protein [Candidatus Thiodiazotropha lotti]|nr:phage portal protein [Candidatus Thiodiazotropha lotti]MCW4188311.1 phage portal protein [Candidatus Thiodiazotropha lotti]
MNLLASIYSLFTGFSTGQRKGRQVAAPSSGAYEENQIVGPDAALQVSSVWAAVTLLVENIASLPLYVYQQVGDSQRAKLTDELIYKVLHESPNSRHTPQEFWEYMLLNFFLRGNAYARIQRNGRGDVVALWPLSADQMDVVLMPDQSLIYQYRLEHEVFLFAEQDIFHIRGKGNGIIGLSPIDYMRASINLAIKAQNHTVQTYSKNARRPGILMSNEVLTEEQRAALKINFGEIVAGGSKELFVLEAGFKFEPLGMSPSDIQLLETRRFSVEDIARWFGVPSVLINDTVDTTTWGTGVKEIIDGFFKLKIRAQLERIEQAIKKQVMTPEQRSKGYMAEFDFDALLRASLAERMEIYAKGVQNGLKTRNECRLKENDPAHEHGDVLTAQVNLAPLNMLGKLKISGASNAEKEPISQ